MSSTIVTPRIDCDSVFERALRVSVWALALCVPIALMVLMWPTMSGDFASFVLMLVLAATLASVVLAAVFWLAAPLVWIPAVMLAAVLTGVVGLVHVVWRRVHKT